MSKGPRGSVCDAQKLGRPADFLEASGEGK